MKIPVQKTICSLLTLILLLSVGSVAAATNDDSTEFIIADLSSGLTEEALKTIPSEDTLDYALYEQADKL